MVNLKRVYLFQIGEQLPFKSDARTMRTGVLAKELVARGYSVTWFTSSFDHFEKKKINNGLDEIDGIKYVYLPSIGYKKNLSLSRLLDHRYLAGRTYFELKKYPTPDLVVSSYPSYDLCAVVVHWAKVRGVPSIVDVRDEWPSVFYEKVPSSLQPIVKSKFFPENLLARYALKNASALTSMMNGMLNWVYSFSGREKNNVDKVFLLGASVEKFTASSRIEKFLQGLPKDSKIISYVGTFGEFNDPREIVRVANEFKGTEKQFVFAGKGDFESEMRGLSRDNKNVHFLGWCSPNEVGTLLENSDLGICPSPVVREGFPNKVFVYLSHGLPVLTSFNGEVVTFLEENNCGAFYHSRDEVALKEIISKALEGSMNFNRRDEIRKVFSDNLDEKKIYKDFADYCEKIIEEREIKCDQRQFQKNL